MLFLMKNPESISSLILPNNGNSLIFFPIYKNSNKFQAYWDINMGHKHPYHFLFLLFLPYFKPKGPNLLLNNVKNKNKN